MVQVHAVSTKAMVAAVDAGVKLLVHLPNKDFMSKDDAKKVAAAGTKVLGTVGFGTPVFGVFAEDNQARFRDGKPWPDSIVDGVRLGEEAGYMPVNARTIWDAGAILGYCTDTTYDPKAGLEHELKTINPMFSMQDIIKMMGPNTASYIQMGDQLGTLEPANSPTLSFSTVIRSKVTGTCCEPKSLSKVVWSLSTSDEQLSLEETRTRLLAALSQRWPDVSFQLDDHSHAGPRLWLGISSRCDRSGERTRDATRAWLLLMRWPHKSSGRINRIPWKSSRKCSRRLLKRSRSDATRWCLTNAIPVL
jgi:hypothetical protein